MAEDKNSPEKLKATVDFWRKQYENVEPELQKLRAQIVALSSETVDAKDKLATVEKNLQTLAEEKNTAFEWLRKLAEHTAGRDGMLQLSKTFCHVCQNPMSCPLGEINKFLDPTQEAA